MRQQLAHDVKTDLQKFFVYCACRNGPVNGEAGEDVEGSL